jgi:Mn-dependent DtxR family transcriptional regulator
VNCFKRIIPFPVVFNRLGAIFHFNKETSKLFLKDMEKRGLIKIIPFKGIKLNPSLMQERKLNCQLFKNKYF